MTDSVYKDLSSGTSDLAHVLTRGHLNHCPTALENEFCHSPKSIVLVLETAGLGLCPYRTVQAYKKTASRMKAATHEIIDTVPLYE